jgi:hypothetical protein
MLHSPLGYATLRVSYFYSVPLRYYTFSLIIFYGKIKWHFHCRRIGLIFKCNKEFISIFTLRLRVHVNEEILLKFFYPLVYAHEK